MRINASSLPPSPGFSTPPTIHSEEDNSLKSLESLPQFELRRIDTLSASLQSLIEERQSGDNSIQTEKGTSISLNWSAVSGIENGTSPSSLRDLVTSKEKEEEEEENEPKTLLDRLIERLETQIEQTEKELEQLENKKGEANEKKREVLREKLAGLTNALAKAREEKIKENEERQQTS